jgi:hypothetical protein
MHADIAVGLCQVELPTQGLQRPAYKPRMDPEHERARCLCGLVTLRRHLLRLELTRFTAVNFVACRTFSCWVVNIVHQFARPRGQSAASCVSYTGFASLRANSLRCTAWPAVPERRYYFLRLSLSSVRLFSESTILIRNQNGRQPTPACLPRNCSLLVVRSGSVRCRVDRCSGEFCWNYVCATIWQERRPVLRLLVVCRGAVAFCSGGCPSGCSGCAMRHLRVGYGPGAVVVASA